MIEELAFHQKRDEQTRRQIRELLDETLFVEAGAGTGKTSALVDRYVALVLAGRRVDELVAITFTEKAAAELRDRVRAELERRLSEGSADAELLQRALVSLDRAQISTIHAFAMGVLRSFAAETGINPSFTVQDEVAAERRFEESWRGALEHFGEDPAARRAINRVLELGMWTGDLEKLARELWGYMALAEMLAATPLAAPDAPWADLHALGQALLDLRAGRVIEGDRLRTRVFEMMHLVQQLLECPAEGRDALLASLLSQKKPSFYVGQAPNWSGSISTARAVAEGTYDALVDTLDGLRGQALSEVLPLLVGFVIDEARRRLRDGALVYDDLILQLRNILRDNADARRSLRGRYKAVLIDEFQDTDPIQTEIALAFATDPATGSIEQGRIFLVGDPKQSIYRFRRADMAVYSETKTRIAAAQGLAPELALNRRSRGVILDFVNTVFERVIGTGAQPAIQPPYRPVRAARDEALSGPGVGWVGGARAERAGLVRRREAAQISAYCRAVLEQGWQVSTREGVRPAAYRDIAVLVPARTILQPLERALAAAAVPYRVEGGSLVYATQEVRDLINCLTAIDDPTDDIAVVGALRSPAYACSDVELAQHKLGGGSFNYLSPALTSQTGRVAGALRDLRDFHLSRHGRSLAALTERFVAAHSAVEAGIFDSGNRNAFRRARFVVEQARSFEVEGPESLHSFVTWLERRAGDAILDHEGAGLDDDEDAVRVLTIHAAKGLEFPIVIVAGLGVSPGNQIAVLGLDRTNDAVAVSIGARTRNSVFSLGPVQAINAQESQHQRAERDRMLYVATTRARDHLLISLYHHSGARQTYAQSLIDNGACEAAAELPELPQVTDNRLPPFAGLAVEADDLTEEEAAAARTELVSRAAQQLVTSATALGRHEAAFGADAAEREDESEPWARGRAGTHRGRAVHAALQVLAWDADDVTIVALARAQAVAEAIPDEADRVAELLRAALATDAASRARSASRSLREVPFAFMEGSVTLEGFVDLVLDGPDGLEVIDWKTDSVSEDEVERRLENYRLQAGLYVLGLQAATGRPVSRLTYVFVSPGVEASPGVPGELSAAARLRVAAVTGPVQVPLFPGGA